MVQAGQSNSTGKSPALSRDAIRRRASAAKQRYSGSAAETVRNRLRALDFINQAMLFAAILLLCFLPFLIVISALAGRDFVDSLTHHIGLNHRASEIVQQLFSPSAQVSDSVTVRGVIFTILGGVGTAATLQAIYERLYALKSRGMRDFHRQLIWIAAVIGVATLMGWMGRHVTGATGGAILFGLVSFLFVSAFWFFTLWVLVGNRVPWRGFVPPAIVTTVCWVGLGVFSKFFFSSTIIGDSRQYGPIGVVFALMSWLIAIGVIVILGAVVGIVWLERDLSLRAALRRVVRPRYREVDKS